MTDEVTEPTLDIELPEVEEELNELERLIREADPKWRPGQPYKHLQSITGVNGNIVKFVKSGDAPGNAQV